MFRIFGLNQAFSRTKLAIFVQNTCQSRSLSARVNGCCFSQSSPSAPPVFHTHLSRNSPESRFITRKMSGRVPPEWRKFMAKFQEAKKQEDGLTKFFINKDLGYGEFNKFGRLNPWCTLDYFEASIILFNTDFVGKTHVSLFARNIAMNFKKGMEARISPGQPLKFQICLTYLGKSSVCWEAQCLDVNTQEELANYMIQMVTVDMNERKPKPYAHLLEQFCPKNLRERPPNGFDIEVKPDTAFKHEFGVNWSDTDFNSHLNQADICRMCVDCGSFAAMENALSAFSQELVAYDLKRCEVMFLKEARPGDKVMVECWESEDNPLVLNFLFSKKGEIITLVQLEYFSGDGKVTSKL